MDANVLPTPQRKRNSSGGRVVMRNMMTSISAKEHTLCVNTTSFLELTIPTAVIR
jgi:hypothetical protein